MSAAKPRRCSAVGVGVDFAGVKALDEVDLELEPGGDPRPDRPERGRQDHPRERALRLPAADQARPARRRGGHRACRRTSSPLRGLARTFQSVRLFARADACSRTSSSARSAAASASPAGARAAERCSSGWASTHAAQLAGRRAARTGEERRLGILRALAVRPRSCCSTSRPRGSTRRESDELVATLPRLPGRVRLGLLVIEHDMRADHAALRADPGARLRQDDRRGHARRGAQGSGA